MTRHQVAASTRVSWVPLTLLVLGLVWMVPQAGFASGGGGGGGMSGGSFGGGSMGSPAKPKTPEELAQQSYERGLKNRDNALGYEAKAAKSDTSWFGKLPSEKAVDSWKDAVENYEMAIERKSNFYEAYSDMGFALRKLGDYDKSLAAYDKALELRPDYTPAIEYRGEAYLKLGRLDDAKGAYMRLFVLDRPLAAQLMETMQGWLTELGEGQVDGVSADQLSQFKAWVSERSQLAGQTGQDVSDARSW